MKTISNGIVATTIAFLISTLFANQTTGKETLISLTQQGASLTTVRIEAPGVQFSSVRGNSGELTQIIIPGESGVTNDEGMPQLPVITQFFQLPEGTSARLLISEVQNRTVRIDAPLLGNISKEPAIVVGDYSGKLYPDEVLRISAPVTIRGVKLAMLTYYPVQYDFDTEEIRVNEGVNATIEFVEDKRNRLDYPQVDLTNTSSEFQRFIAALTGRDEILRDLSGQTRDHSGHYLIVSREECLPYAIELLEWKRQTGYKVDIFTYSGQATAPDIKRDIQRYYSDLRNANLPPFDYILLLGDRAGQQGTGAWSLPSFQGSPTMQEFPNHADYMYGLLEGGDDDFYPDVAVGRFGSGSQSRMELAVERTLAYERRPSMDNREWFNRAGVFSETWGDDWDYTLILGTRWGEQALISAGFRDIQIAEATGQNNPQIPVSSLTRWLNETPMSLMIGRAQLDVWHDNFIGVENNVIFPIGINYCGHGEFAMNTMFNSGSIDNTKGFVALTTGWGTPQTKYSNAVWMAMVKGVLVHDLALGWSRVYSGAMMPRLFASNDMELVGRIQRTYQTDFDFYGDPGLKPWTAIPRRLEVGYPANLSPGANAVYIWVKFEDSPIEDAQVSLYYPGELPEPEEYADWQPRYQQVGWTDQNGEVVLPLDPDLPEGVVYLTVTGRNLLPFEGEIEIAQQPLFVSLESYDIDDSNGNHNGVVNPGELVEIRFTARNTGSNITAMNVRAVLRSSSQYVDILDTLVEFGNIPAGEVRQANGANTIRIRSDCSDAIDAGLYLAFFSGNSSWRSRVPLDIVGSRIELSGILPDEVIPEMASNIRFELANSGRTSTRNLTAVLSSQSWAIRILDDSALYSGIPAGEVRMPNGEDVFRLVPHSMAVPGMQVSLKLTLSDSDRNIVGEIPVDLQISQPRSGVPHGPDEYGYVALDNSDTNWEFAPVYSWIPVAPDESGNGVRLPLEASDYGTATVVRLPFRLRFYGTEYDSITICSNGFIAVGNQIRNINFQNFALDMNIGGAFGMIAPYWDNLDIARGQQIKGVYTYYDEENNRYIIEWYRVRARYDNRDQIFQTVLYDPRVYPTVTGDSPILFQYKEIVLTAGGTPSDGPFVSVGLSNPDGTSGLGYAHSDLRAVANDTLINNRAILFSTLPNSESGLSGRITGSITSMQNGVPIDNVEVTLKAYGFGGVYSSFSNVQGNYDIENVTSGQYLAEVKKAGYNRYRQWVNIEPAGNVVLNARLKHPTINLNRSEIVDSLAPGHTANREFWISNRGDDTLTYKIEITRSDNLPTNWIRRFNTNETGKVSPNDSISAGLRINTAGLENGDYSAVVRVLSADAQIEDSIRIRLNLNPSNSVNKDIEAAPVFYSLGPAYPNPFNGTTVMNFALKNASHTRLVIYDIGGREVLRPVNGRLPAGVHSVTLDLSGVSPGVYICQMKAETYSSAIKLVLVE